MVQALAGMAPLMGSAGGFGGNGLGIFILPVLLIVVMYFLMIRPQKQREKKQQERRNAMEVGDQIMTIGGILGKVVNIKGDEVTISTSVANSLLTFRKDAIREIKKPESAVKAAAGSATATTPAAPAEDTEKKGFFGRFKKS